MSMLTFELMTNHHVSDVLAQLRETLHVWRQRQVQRGELAGLSERDRHDLRLTSSDVQFEVQKPFWRA